MPESTMPVAFRIKLREGKLADYIATHDRIPEDWPELEQAIAECGIKRMRIIAIDPDLYVVADVTDENAFPRLWETDVHREWEKVMQPLMQPEDGSFDRVN
ncbi:MAG: L-rhamnose mutarotase, partial [Acidimicrobiia bacterium]